MLTDNKLTCFYCLWSVQAIHRTTSAAESSPESSSVRDFAPFFHCRMTTPRSYLRSTTRSEDFSSPMKERTTPHTGSRFTTGAGRGSNRDLSEIVRGVRRCVCVTRKYQHGLSPLLSTIWLKHFPDYFVRLKRRGG